MSHSVDGARGHKTRGAEGGTSNKGVAHVRPAEGRRSLRVFGELVTCKVTSDQTGGAYSLFEVITQPGEGPPPHVHHREDESFYVLEGEYEFFSGEGILLVGAGSLLCVSNGALHAHKNVCEDVGRLLATQTPGACTSASSKRWARGWTATMAGGPPSRSGRILRGSCR